MTNKPEWMLTQEELHDVEPQCSIPCSECSPNAGLCSYRQVAIYAQTKLLEYLKEDLYLSDADKDKLESMLEQIAEVTQ